MTQPRRLTRALLAGALTLTGATSAIVGPAAGPAGRVSGPVVAAGPHGNPQCDPCPDQV